MRWLLAVLLLMACTSLAVPPKVVHRPDPDIKCLAWVLDDEARGEPLKGARAVLDVVKKRMQVSGRTACQVVAERKQFSGYKPGVFEKISKEMLTRYETVRKMSPVAPDCEYFHATYVHPPWRLRLVRCKQIGNHIFYKPLKEK